LGHPGLAGTDIALPIEMLSTHKTYYRLARRFYPTLAAAINLYTLYS